MWCASSKLGLTAQLCTMNRDILHLNSDLALKLPKIAASQNYNGATTDADLSFASHVSYMSNSAHYIRIYIYIYIKQPN